MLSLIVFILASIGFTQIVVREFVFSKVRDIVQGYSGEDGVLTSFINCATCVGFWIGLLLTLVCPALLTINVCLIAKVMLGAGISAIVNKTYTLYFQN